jgi:mRNA interferase RelE/StbE
MTSDADAGVPDRYAIVVRRAARRALSEELPIEVAFAVSDFVTGALLESPQRVGKRLDPPLDDQHSARVGECRILYEIDEKQRRVVVRSIRHRRDAYRT